MPLERGTRSFTFAKSLFSPGNHEVKLQWKSTGGRCQLGDRTMVGLCSSLQCAAHDAKPTAIA